MHFVSDSESTPHYNGYENRGSESVLADRNLLREEHRMSNQLKAKLYSLSRPKTIRMIYLLVVVVAMALAAGAPDAWGGGGGG